MTQMNISIKQALGSPLDYKKVKPVSAKGSHSWIFIGRTDAEAETPILWPSDAKNWLFGKDPDAGKDRRHEEKGTSEDEMVVWHHRLIGHEFKQALSWWWTGRPGMLQFMGLQSQAWLSDCNDKTDSQTDRMNLLPRVVVVVRKGWIESLGLADAEYYI